MTNHKYLERLLLAPTSIDGPCDDESREIALGAIYSADVAAVRGSTVAVHSAKGVVWMEAEGGIVKFNWLPANDSNNYTFTMNVSSVRDVSSVLSTKPRITMDEFIVKY